MEQIELEQFKRRLEVMLEALKQPSVRSEEISIENSPDALDQVQSAAEREMAIGRLESEFRRRRSIMAALERIQEGTYGVCTQCEAEMGIKRLNAVPWTEYCLECQIIADREESAQATETPLTRFAGGSFDLG
jgi:DnaK suppressor protein